MATIENNYTFNTTVNERGPKGDKGSKGDPGFIAFEIIDGDLYCEQSTGIVLTLVNGFLYMEVE